MFEHSYTCNKWLETMQLYPQIIIFCSTEFMVKKTHYIQFYLKFMTISRMPDYYSYFSETIYIFKTHILTTSHSQFTAITILSFIVLITSNCYYYYHLLLNFFKNHSFALPSCFLYFFFILFITYQLIFELFRQF